MKRLLSFDVGIKNLSYCLMEIDEDYNYKIIEWNIINLLNDETENKCSKYRKNGNKCTSKSSFKHNNEYFCKTHEPKELKCKKLKKPNCNKVSILKLKTTLYQEFLNNYQRFNDCEYILIELQPVLKNPKMKSLANAIYDYFLIETIKNNDNKVITNISASSKLKIIEGFDFKKKKYDYNKQQAILYTSKLVINTEWENHFNTFPKKDDLADSLLQGLYYLKTISPKK